MKYATIVQFYSIYLVSFNIVLCHFGIIGDLCHVLFLFLLRLSQQSALCYLFGSLAVPIGQEVEVGKDDGRDFDYFFAYVDKAITIPRWHKSAGGCECFPGHW